MARYANQQIKTQGLRRSFTTTKYPKINKTLSDIYVIATSADRLDTLSFQFYGRSDYWWIIANVNGLGRGTLNIPAGQQLRIPTNIDGILQDFNRLNNVT